MFLGVECSMDRSGVLESSGKRLDILLHAAKEEKRWEGREADRSATCDSRVVGNLSGGSQRGGDERHSKSAPFSACKVETLE